MNQQIQQIQQIINVTPHAITVELPSGVRITYPPSGIRAKIEAKLFPLLGQVAMAVVQVSQAATPTQLKQARQVLADARRGLYQILAEGEGEEVSEAEAAGEPAGRDPREGARRQARPLWSFLLIS